MINLTQIKLEEPLKETHGMIQVRNILKTYDHQRQAFNLQNQLQSNDTIRIEPKIRQMRQINPKPSIQNKVTSYSQNAVRNVLNEGILKKPQQNNNNFDNSKNKLQNNKYYNNFPQIFPQELIKQKTQPITVTNLQKRIRTYSQEILKSYKPDKLDKLPDVDDFRLSNIKKSSEFFRMEQKRCSLTNNQSPNKEINFIQKYSKNVEVTPFVPYKQRMEQMEKNWQELLKENDFI